MRCLRIYASADGESHFDEVNIPTSKRPRVIPSRWLWEVRRPSYRIRTATGIRRTTRAAVLTHASIQL